METRLYPLLVLPCCVSVHKSSHYSPSPPSPFTSIFFEIKSASSMAPHLLTLPREIRDRIYQHLLLYVLDDYLVDMYSLLYMRMLNGNISNRDY